MIRASREVAVLTVGVLGCQLSLVRMNVSWSETACGQRRRRGMLVRMTSKITRINPEQLHSPPGYHQVTVVEAGRTAFLAGQCPLDAAGVLVGEGNLDAQVDQVVANALIAIGAVAAQPSDVVRTVIYVVSDDTSVLGAAWQRLTRSPLGPAFTTASTLLGVTQLGYRGQLIEVDLTVALSG